MIHPTAILNHEPSRSGVLAQPTDGAEPCSLGNGVEVGPNAVIQRGVAIGDDTMIGIGAIVLGGAKIGERCLIGAFARIGRGAIIGDGTKILGGADICAGTVIGRGVVVGMNAVTTNDDNFVDWRRKELRPARVGDGVQIGAGAVILPGVVIGDGARIGAGAVVRRDVLAGVTAIGVPARAMQSDAALTAEQQASLAEYWAARTPEAERSAYSRMLALGMPDAYAAVPAC